MKEAIAIKHMSKPEAATSLSNSSPEAFFDSAYRAFDQATGAGAEVREFYYEIGGFPICIRIVGPAMATRLTPALAHNAISPTAPALTICVWDTVSTDVAMPTPPWEHADYLKRAEVRGYSNDRILTAYDVWGGALRMLDTQQNIGIFWTRDAATLQVYDRGAPLRMILHWWMRERGRQFVHAGAVGTAEGGVLLAGKSGSGKSTTAVSCLDSDLLYASDDYCLISTEPTPYVYSLYSSTKLESVHLEDRLAHLKPLISNPEEIEEEKALLFLAQHYPNKVTRGFPIRAILLPRVTGKRETTLTQASPVAALKALAPSTMLQLSGTGQQEFRAMSTFVKQVPSYHLELGTNLGQIPQIIEKLLRRDHE